MGYCHLLFYILQIHYVIRMQEKKTCPPKSRRNAVFPSISSENPNSQYPYLSPEGSCGDLMPCSFTPSAGGLGAERRCDPGVGTGFGAAPQGSLISSIVTLP